MGNIFSGSEVIGLGIMIEQNGRDFYRTLAANTKNESSRKVFSRLSAEEEKHIAVFQGMLEKAGGSDISGEAYPEEYQGYLAELAGKNIFTQEDTGRGLASEVKSEEKAIDLGIGFEQDSIIFYQGIKKVVPDYDHKIIDGLITQEEAHLKLLLGLKQK